MLGRGVILALILVATSTATAAPPDYEAAKRHYQAAEKAAAEGKYKLAAREYGIAYDITKDPVLFFKIGYAYDRADDCTTAKVYYLRYLKEGKPAPEFKQRTQALIRACKNRGRRSSADPATADTPADTARNGRHAAGHPGIRRVAHRPAAGRAPGIRHAIAGPAAGHAAAGRHTGARHAIVPADRHRTDDTDPRAPRHHHHAPACPGRAAGATTARRRLAHRGPALPG